MRWYDKIDKLTEGINASHICTKAGLPRNAIRRAATSKNMPIAAKGVKIAKALGVPPDWLFDDNRDWPPPSYDEPSVGPRKSDSVNGMSYRQKIAKLVDSRSEVELSRRAGLPSHTLNAITKRGREPLARKAIQIARFFEVPADWLFDDSQPWPPPVKECGTSDSRVHQLEQRIDMLLHLLAERTTV